MARAKKSVSDDAASSKKALKTKKTVDKKKRKMTRKQTYSVYIYRVLKQVFPTDDMSQI